MNYYMAHYRPKMPKREIEALIMDLKEIRKTATMENASFFTFDPDSEKKMDKLRELTRTWRETYILFPLNELIERYEQILKEQSK